MASIKGQVSELTWREVDLHVHETAAIPRWASQRSQCDECRFDFESDDMFVTAVRTERGVLYLHQQCAARAIK